MLKHTYPCSSSRQMATPQPLTFSFLLSFACTCTYSICPFMWYVMLIMRFVIFNLTDFYKPTNLLLLLLLLCIHHFSGFRTKSQVIKNIFPFMIFHLVIFIDTLVMKPFYYYFYEWNSLFKMATKFFLCWLHVKWCISVTF